MQFKSLLLRQQKPAYLRKICGFLVYKNSVLPTILPTTESKTDFSA